MQIGLYAEGMKRVVLKQLEIQAEEQKKKFGKECAETQIPVYGPGGVVVKHRPCPLDNFTGDKVIDALVENITEQLHHVSDQEEVAVSAQITVHRPNPV